MLTVNLEVGIYEVRNMLWSGAKTNVSLLTDDELLMILDILDECSTPNWTMTTVNDFFWFDTDTYAEWLGYKDFEQLWQERAEKYISVQ